MLRKEFLQDTFGMLSFLRLIGLRINGRMLGLFGGKLSPQDIDYSLQEKIHHIKDS